ncbi:DUF4265 domain-containing protein [Enhygromyxa salina]|uniref:DUF4265 domain-containing protein n=1 Tax=Enhygromyxa salina TaxID=215803 RepID=UPI000696224B|nr:DUF4265 domain-containing protein [Enhygromyxa salina]
MSRTAKIVFELEPDEDGFPPIGSEGLHATPLEDGSFVLDNTPFFVTEVALGDRIAADPISGTEGKFAFSHVLEPSSAKSISIIFLVKELEQGILDNLRSRDCYCEFAEIRALRMLAVSVPETCNYDELRAYLMKHEADKALSFAELAV